MLVLDATDKSLQIVLDADVGANALEVVVSYWSVDTANQWTPKSYESAPATLAATTILAAPTAGAEVARVVENVWIFNADTAATNDIVIQMLHGAVVTRVRRIDTLPINGTAVLKRDGSVAEETV